MEEHRVLVDQSAKVFNKGKLLPSNHPLHTMLYKAVVDLAELTRRLTEVLPVHKVHVKEDPLDYFHGQLFKGGWMSHDNSVGWLRPPILCRAQPEVQHDY